MPDGPRAPESLRHLVSWQTGRLATIGARLTAQHMPLEARSDFAVLASLDEYGPLSQAELGRVLGLDRNNVNGIVVRLDARAQITRTPDPDDRRRNIVSITAAGRSRFATLRKSAAEVQDELLAELEPAERNALIRLLEKALASHPAQPA